MADDLEGAIHDLGHMVADRAGTQLQPVAHDVVLIAQHRQRVLRVERLKPALRHRERVVREIQRLFLVVPFIHREIDDPGELELVFPSVVRLQLGPDHVARLARDGCELARVAGEEERGVAGLEAKLDAQRLGALGADVFRQRAGALKRAAFLAPEDIPHPRQPFLLRPGIHPVAERAGAAAGGGDGADLAAARDDLGEDLEARVAEVVGDDLHLDRVAQVGLVGAVFQQRLGVGDAREFLRHRPPAAELLEHAPHHRFDHLKHVLLLDEAHLHVELVELARRAVGAGVFVAETGRDLEIAVEARDHRQLLELLRRLRQGVEFSGVQARGHEEVARALGAGRGQDRGLIFGKALFGHAAAQGRDHLRAQHDVAVQGLAAQVEEAVFQPHVLGIVRLAEHRDGQLLGLRQHGDRLRIDLDLAGLKPGVDQPGVARLDRSIDADHPLGAHRLRILEGGAVGVGDDLSHAVMVAQVDEQQAAVIAHAQHPARQADGRARVGRAKGGAGVAAVGVHGGSPDRRQVCGLRRSA